MNMKIRNLKRLLGAALGVMLFVAGIVSAQETDKAKEEEMIRVANQVRKQILMLTDFDPFDSISYRVEPVDKGYKVILKGYASRPTLQQAAENVVKRVEAVESVDNQIEVLPTSRMDEDIRLKAYAKIYNAPSLARYNPNYGTPIYGSPQSFRNTVLMGISTNPPMGYHPISIIVKSGHIILEGVVDNEADKNVAGMMANQVSGVFSVTNNLVALQPAKKKE